MNRLEIAALLEPGESIDPIPPPDPGSTEWAYGYGIGEILDSTHTEGNSVVLTVEPQGAVEPVLITEDIVLRARSLQGSGLAIACNVESQGPVRLYVLSETTDPIAFGRGDAYYYLNTGSEPLVIRDDATPAFRGTEELALTPKPTEPDAPDGRTIELPPLFWKAFEMNS